MTEKDITAIIVIIVVITLFVLHKKKQATAPIFVKHLPFGKNLVNIMFLTSKNINDKNTLERVKKIFFDGDVLTSEEHSSMDLDIDRVEGKREKFLLEQISSELVMRSVCKHTTRTGEENKTLLVSYDAEFATAECKNDVPQMSFGQNYERFLREKPMNKSDLKSFCKIGDGKFTLKMFSVEVEAKTTKIISLDNIDAYASFEKNGILLSMRDGSALIVNFYKNGCIQKNEVTDSWNVHDEKIQTLYALDALMNVQ